MARTTEAGRRLGGSRRKSRPVTACTRLVAPVDCEADREVRAVAVMGWY